MKIKKLIIKHKKQIVNVERQTRVVTAEYFKMHFIYVDTEAKIARCNGEVFKVLIHGPTIVRMVKEI